MTRPDIVIVTPALADANNGNWQTARRWARMLSGIGRVRITDRWDAGTEALMVALHARRSAPSALRWRQQRGDAPLVVALTGTDLYRDIATDTDAQAVLHAADRIVVLNEHGPRALPPALQARAVVVLQSCSARQVLPRPGRHLRALMVGHLRPEKAPDTYFAAARLLAGRPDILLDHAGQALQSALAEEATALMAACPNYRWLGGLPHADVRRRIQAAHVLVQPSRMEGGANTVIEAVRSGTPVLASRIPGNLGLLGDGYAGTFEVGDAPALAALLQRARDEPAMLAGLQRQCAARAPLFEPAREAAALQAVAGALLQQARRPAPVHP